MKTRNWLRKLADYLSGKSVERLDRKAAVRKLLRKLRKKQKGLERRLQEEEDPAVQAELENMRRVVLAHRRKAIARLQELRAEEE